MSFGGDAPTPPDPTATAGTQAGYNLKAGQQSQQLNMVGQSTPYGSLSYGVVGKNPDGTPRYGATMGTSATGGKMLESAGKLFGMYGAPPNLDPSTMINKTMGLEEQYLDPFFKHQTEELDANLHNQGIAPGSDAYDFSKRGLEEGQAGVMADRFAQIEPLAFNQEVQRYTLPGQVASTLYDEANPLHGFTQTPTTSVQPPNYQQLASDNYKAQLQQYQANQSGMYGLLGAGLGAAGFAMGGPVGGMIGSGIGSGIKGMFAPTPAVGYGGGG